MNLTGGVAALFSARKERSVYTGFSGKTDTDSGPLHRGNR